MSRWSIPFVCLLLGGLVGGVVADKALQGQNVAAPVIPGELTSYRDVVKNVLPAVVSIEARSKPKAAPVGAKNRRQPNFDEQQVPEQFRKFFEDGGKGPQFEMPDNPRVGFGSGFIVDPKGVIMTNYHVVNGADTVEVKLSDGRKFVSKDIKTDSKTDLAIVRVDAKDLPWLDFGDSDTMAIGDRVLAVGAPFGLTGSVTHGIVSAKGRNGLHMNLYEDFLQTDAAINPGNSGGPLINLEGKVVGINTAIKSHSGGFQGVGLAIASNLAKNVKQQLLENGTVRRGYLGVQIKELDAEVGARLGVNGKGVVVGTVFDGSPAAKGGLQAGDVITGVAGKPIKDAHDLQTTIAALPLGKPSDVNVVRDGKATALKVTIEEQPEDFGAARVPSPRVPKRNSNSISMEKVGVEVTDMTSEMAEQLGYKAPVEGALIAGVENDSVAGQAGLQRGMVVIKVDKTAVKSAAAFREAMEKVALDKGVLLQVQSPRGGTDYVMLKATTESSQK